MTYRAEVGFVPSSLALAMNLSIDNKTKNIWNQNWIVNVILKSFLSDKFFQMSFEIIIIFFKVRLQRSVKRQAHDGCY